MAALELKAPLGTGLCALRPEENFFCREMANFQVPFDKTGWGGAS